MKTLFSALFALIILGAIGWTCLKVYQNFFIAESGERVEEKVEIGSFDELTLDGVLNFYITQGQKESVWIEADEQIIKDIEIENKGNELIIKLDNHQGFASSVKANVHITVTNLSKLNIEGIGNVTVESLKVGDLELDVAGVGNKSFDLYCNELHATISSVGNVTFTGKAKKVEIKNSSVGNLKADELKTKQLWLENKGAGNVKVYAEKEISIVSKGIGNIHYGGDAEVKELEINGIGKVKKM